MNRLALITVWLYTLLASTAYTAQAEAKRYVCIGEIGNGYATTRPEFKVFGSRTFHITTLCTKKGAACDYFFNGSRYEGYLYDDGALSLPHLGPHHWSPDGFLTFKMSETTEGIGGNEGQRWFIGMCRED